MDKSIRIRFTIHPSEHGHFGKYKTEQNRARYTQQVIRKRRGCKGDLRNQVVYETIMEVIKARLRTISLQDLRDMFSVEKSK